MADALHASILFRLSHTRRAQHAPDPADLGTAFGLEMSLTDDAAPDDAPAQAPSWLERLGLMPSR